MEKIVIHKQFTKPDRKESVMCWVSRDISDKCDQISNETGISKQRVMDFLLKKAINALVIVEPEV